MGLIKYIAVLSHLTAGKQCTSFVGFSADGLQEQCISSYLVMKILVIFITAMCPQKLTLKGGVLVLTGSSSIVRDVIIQCLTVCTLSAQIAFISKCPFLLYKTTKHKTF